MAMYLTNGLVIDCATDELAPFPATVVVEDGSITAIQPGGGETAPPPKTATVVDLEGRYLLPGLWDSHCHPGGMIPDPNRMTAFETEAERTLRAARNTMAA
ncbi:MAG: hypothetical protein PVG54_11995, partial [Anaerolineae bacterium]